jgi:ankyrin repeat protein
MEILLLFGAELEALDEYGDSALSVAVNLGKLETVQLLLDLNADMTKSNKYGWNVLLTERKKIKQRLSEHLKKSVRNEFCLFDFAIRLNKWHSGKRTRRNSD